MLHIHHFTFNPFQENTWLVWNDAKDCLIIDPGCYSSSEKQELKQFIEDNKLTPHRLINTHCHIDHVLGNPFIHKTYGLQPEIHPNDKFILDNVEQYGKMWNINSDVQPEPICNLDKEREITLGDETLEIVYTPGHAPGEVSLISHKHKFVIAGDVLFRESIGRTDLPGGNMDTLIKSIKEKLMILEDDYAVHCGHGPSTTVGHERKYNPFF